MQWQNDQLQEKRLRIFRQRGMLQDDKHHVCKKWASDKRQRMGRPIRHCAAVRWPALLRREGELECIKMRLLNDKAIWTVEEINSLIVELTEKQHNE